MPKGTALGLPCQVDNVCFLFLLNHNEQMRIHPDHGQRLTQNDSLACSHCALIWISFATGRHGELPHPPLTLATFDQKSMPTGQHKLALTLTCHVSHVSRFRSLDESVPSCARPSSPRRRDLRHVAGIRRRAPCRGIVEAEPAPAGEHPVLP